MYAMYLVQTTHAEVVELSLLVYEDKKLEDSEVNHSQMPGNQSLQKGQPITILRALENCVARWSRWSGG
jgi:hypothetical protein